MAALAIFDNGKLLIPVPGKWRPEVVKDNEIASVEVASEESVKDIGGAVGWSLAGAAVLGPLGLVGGLLLGGRGKDVIFVCELKDGRKFLAKTSSKNYTRLKVSTFQNKPEPASDTKICPFCAESVKSAALLCHYCKKEFPQSELTDLNESGRASPLALSGDTRAVAAPQTSHLGTSSELAKSPLLQTTKPMEKIVTFLRRTISLLIAFWALLFMCLGWCGIIGGLVSLSGAAILHPSTASYLAKHTSRWVKPGHAFMAAIGLWSTGTLITVGLAPFFLRNVAVPSDSTSKSVTARSAAIADEDEEASQPTRTPASPISKGSLDSTKRSAERRALWEKKEQKRQAAAQKKQASADKKQAAREKKQAEENTADISEPNGHDQTYPFKLVTILSQPMHFSGMECSLQIEGDGWHKSDWDGSWNAVLRRSFGENEVSCLLESDNASTVKRVELEAEFYQPDSYENEMLLQFVQSAQVLMHPATPPEEFAEAVINKATWSNAQWELKREAYANDGFGLMLRRK